MIGKHDYHWPTAIVLMTITVVLGDFLLLMSPNREYYVLFTVISLLYVLPYLSVTITAKHHPPLSFCILFFVLLKVYYIIVQNSSGALALSDGGDAASLHIPQAQNLISLDNYIDHLFSIGGVYNGRLTHVLLALYLDVLEYFNFSTLDYVNLHNLAYLFNALICTVTIYIYYKAALNFSSSVDFSRRAVWFLAFNPYFFAITSLPQKESLLFFALSLFVLFLSRPLKNLSTLIAALFIISMERIYMVPLLVTILLLFDSKGVASNLFSRKGGLLKLALLSGSLILIEWFIGIETALSMHEAHVESLTDIDGSFVEGHGLLSNLTRTFFGPAFFRPFLSEYVSYDMFYLSHNLMFIFYSYVAVKAALSPKGIGLAILLSYMFVLIFIPFHGSFKIMLVVFFGGLFLDKIAMIPGTRTARHVRFGT